MLHLRSAALLRKLRVLSAWAIVAGDEKDREKRTSRKSAEPFNDHWRFLWYISKSEFLRLASQSRRRFLLFDIWCFRTGLPPN